MAFCLTQRAAEKGIAQVVFSRIVMAMPGMSESASICVGWFVGYEDTTFIMRACVLCGFVYVHVHNSFLKAKAIPCNGF